MKKKTEREKNEWSDENFVLRVSTSTLALYGQTNERDELEKKRNTVHNKKASDMQKNDRELAESEWGRKPRKKNANNSPNQYLTKTKFQCTYQKIDSSKRLRKKA